MTANNLRLALFGICLIITQFFVNNFTIFYVDLFAILLVSILMLGSFSWGMLIILSIVADVIGHWALGSHLLAIILLSIFSGRFVNFYGMFGFFQRTIVTALFFLALIIISYIIELLTGKVFTSVRSILLEIFILLPLVQFILGKFIFKRSSDLIYHD